MSPVSPFLAHPKVRQILLAWIAAWPTLTLILFVLRPVTEGWSLPLRALASSTGMVLTMNLVSLPLVRLLIRRWREFVQSPHTGRAACNLLRLSAPASCQQPLVARSAVHHCKPLHEGVTTERDC